MAMAMDWPRVIPLFPLPNVVLFPGPLLPLHIFEMRYREMLHDVQAGDGIIGMVLLRRVVDGREGERAETYSLGCAGEVVQVEPQDDGRSYILLRGLRQFRIEREVEGKPYRRAEVTWLDYDATPLDRVARTELRAAIRALISAAGEPDLEKLLAEDDVGDDLFVNVWSSMLSVPVVEKQALLAEPSLAARAARLREVIEFRLAELRAGTVSAGEPERFH